MIISVFDWIEIAGKGEIADRLSKGAPLNLQKLRKQADIHQTVP